MNFEDEGNSQLRFFPRTNFINGISNHYSEERYALKADNGERLTACGKVERVGREEGHVEEGYIAQSV